MLSELENAAMNRERQKKATAKRKSRRASNNNKAASFSKTMIAIAKEKYPDLLRKLTSKKGKKVKTHNPTYRKKSTPIYPVEITRYTAGNKIEREIIANSIVPTPKKNNYVYIEKNQSTVADVNADEFLTSYHWRKIRMEVLIRDGRKCVCCGATPATGAVMNVDHIKPRRLYPELALDINNLQVLCNECNHGKGNWDTTDWKNK